MKQSNGKGRPRRRNIAQCVAWQDIKPASPTINHSVNLIQDGEHDAVNVDKSGWNSTRLWLDSLTGRQLVAHIKEGHTVGDLTFDEWLKMVGDDLKFGQNASEEFKQDMRCLLYALNEAITTSDTKPGIIQGVSHRIELKDPIKHEPS